MDLYYELYGEGKPLVLIAGYTGDHMFWSLMLDQLAKKFQVLIFDNRGIGQTKDKGASFTLDTMADDTIALTEQLGLVKPHIIGQSMGGAIAQLIAKKYADKIDKLIILNSVAKFNLRTIKTLESLLNLRKENIAFDLFLDAAMPWFFSSDYLAQTENIITYKQALINVPYPQSISDQERQFNALLSFDSRDWLARLTSPTLVLAAEDDIIALPAESQHLANQVANTRFKMIPGAHSSPLEQPQEVNKAILSFLSS